jgi:hypothetical protein
MSRFSLQSTRTLYHGAEAMYPISGIEEHFYSPLCNQQAMILEPNERRKTLRRVINICLRDHTDRVFLTILYRIVRGQLRAGGLWPQTRDLLIHQFQNDFAFTPKEYPFDELSDHGWTYVRRKCDRLERTDWRLMLAFEKATCDLEAYGFGSQLVSKS